MSLNVWIEETLRRVRRDGRDEVWDAYRANLRIVLDDVELLLENLDAERVVVTADHGNLFGEWGMYGHEDGVILPSLKRVPWCTATGRDEGTHEPSLSRTDESGGVVEGRLRDLGYR